MWRSLSVYFATSAAHDGAVIRERLWRDGDDVSPPGSPAYSAAVMDQYRLYVEMADRVSQRRAAANSFFLTVNTAVFTVIGVLWNRRPGAASWVLTFPVVVLVAQCLMWFWVVRSYRQLNSAKFAVVAALEERLPASPYGRAEWVALGEGRDPRVYWPLTHVESFVPLLFALTYVGAFVAALVA